MVSAYRLPSPLRFFYFGYDIAVGTKCGTTYSFSCRKVYFSIGVIEIISHRADILKNGVDFLKKGVDFLEKINAFF